VKTKVKSLVLLLFSAVLVFLLGFTAFAANYKVWNVHWDEASERGYAVVTWSHSEDKADATTWAVRLYRGDKALSKWIRTDKDYVDFSVLIGRTGTGRYYAEVYSVKGGKEKDLGNGETESLVVKSEVLLVDGDELTSIRNWVKEHPEGYQVPDTAYGWIKTPNGSWKYRYDDGSFATSWKDINGKTYYFSANGIMLTGWQIIKNRWYYFDEENGFLYRDTVTPAGYYVDATGALCLDGVQADASFQPKNTEKNSARTLTDLTTIKVNSKETKVASNVVRPMAVTGDGKFTVETYEFSEPYENWKAGVPILVSCTLSANTGYCFTDNTQVTFNRGKLISFTGNAIERSLTYEYYPRLVLPSPANVSLGSDSILRWSPCKNAAQYVIKLSLGGERMSDIYTSTTHYDFTEFESQPDLSFTICAIASESVRNYYYDSFETKVSDIDTIRINGKLIQTTDSLLYKDDLDNKVDGWVEMLGHWFHFSSGFASGPGWWMDSDGSWYYFDGNYHMMTGTVVVDGVAYFLNDGSRTDLPRGALVQ